MTLYKYVPYKAYILSFYFFVEGRSPTPYPLFSRPLFVCKFGCQGSTAAFFKPRALAYSIGYIILRWCIRYRIDALWMKSSRSHNSAGFDTSIQRHSGIRGAADEAELNTVRYLHRKKKNPPVNLDALCSSILFIIATFTPSRSNLNAVSLPVSLSFSSSSFFI